MTATAFSGERMMADDVHFHRENSRETDFPPRLRTIIAAICGEHSLNHSHARPFLPRGQGELRAEDEANDRAPHIKDEQEIAMKNSRKPFLGLIAISAALAMPLAFAQEAVPQDPQDPTQMQEQVPPTAEQTPAPAEATTTAPQALTWADLDTDGDGKLSKEEVASVDALVQAFDNADTDGDGLLTPEEYTAYVSSSNEAAPPTEGGGLD